MKRFLALFLSWHLTNTLLLAVLAAFLYCLAWDRSTTRYVEGFSDAIVPAEADAETKIESILGWMRSGPPRPNQPVPGIPSRDPHDTLNFGDLLRVCGSATNAFVNLSNSSGVEARRLLLLDENRTAKHVVAEALVDGRWIVVDPLYRAILRGPNGRPLTKEQLDDPETWRQATAGIPGYSPLYTFERTSHLRLAAIPVVGRPLRRFLDSWRPGWDSWPGWSMLLERRSLLWSVFAGAACSFLLILRFSLAVFAERRLGIVRARFRDRLVQAFRALLASPR